MRASKRVRAGVVWEEQVAIGIIAPTPTLKTPKSGRFFDAAGKASAIYLVKSEKWMCASSGIRQQVFSSIIDGKINLV